MEIGKEAALLIDTLIAIVALIVLITNLKFHPFLALILAAGLLAWRRGCPRPTLSNRFRKAFGDVLGFVGIVIGLGTMLGKLMAVSGGAIGSLKPWSEGLANGASTGQCWQLPFWLGSRCFLKWGLFYSFRWFSRSRSG